MLKDNVKHINGIPVIYIPEPVEEWESIVSIDGKNMIELFYENKEKYAFSFQMMAYISRLDYLIKIQNEYPDCILVSERSLYADYHVFAKMLYEDNYISIENYQIYMKWFNSFTTDIDVTGIIYLKTPATVCNERCNTRSRKGESIPLDYLMNCEKKHDDWIDNTIISTLELENNSLEEIEKVEQFIKEEMFNYKLSISCDEFDKYVNDPYLFQLASGACLCAIAFGYLLRIFIIGYRIIQ
jgi:deoxyadenosine/deoxycytidine kinase